MNTITGCKICMARFIWLFGLLWHVSWWVCTGISLLLPWKCWKFVSL